MTDQPRTAEGRALLTPAGARRFWGDVPYRKKAILAIEAEAATPDAAGLREALLDLMQHHRHHYLPNPLQRGPCDIAQNKADAALDAALAAPAPPAGLDEPNAPHVFVYGTSEFRCEDCTQQWDAAIHVPAVPAVPPLDVKRLERAVAVWVDSCAFPEPQTTILKHRVNIAAIATAYAAGEGEQE